MNVEPGHAQPTSPVPIPGLGGRGVDGQDAAPEPTAPPIDPRTEIESYLSEDTARLGEVYRGIQRGQNADEIAVELGVATDHAVTASHHDATLKHAAPSYTTSLDSTAARWPSERPGRTPTRRRPSRCYEDTRRSIPDSWTSAALTAKSCAHSMGTSTGVGSPPPSWARSRESRALTAGRRWFTSVDDLEPRSARRQPSPAAERHTEQLCRDTTRCPPDRHEEGTPCTRQLSPRSPPSPCSRG